jgi:tetratricopeptide (TPR) repeat protein
LRLREARYGPHHLDVAKSCNTLATFHATWGEYDRAVAYKRRALDIRTEKLGPRDTLVARTAHEFGVLDVARGHYRDAVPHFEQALAVFDAPPYPDSTRLANLLNDVGELRRIEARYAAAESCYHSVPWRSVRGASRLRTCGSPNRRTIWPLVPRRRSICRCRALARALLATARRGRRGRFGGARERSAQSRRAVPPARPAEEAAARYDEALRIARRALGDGHPDLVWFANQAAVFASERGNAARAESLYRESIAILQRAGGPAVLEAQTEHDLAELLQGSRRFAAAESLYASALATRESVLGPGHPDVALTLVGLGRCLHAQSARRDPEALATLVRAAAILDATHAEPEGRVEAYAARARIQAERGALPEAIASMGVALDQIESLRPQRGAGEASRVRFLARHAGDADAMVDWCLRTGNIGRGIETIERGRARAFLDRVAAAPFDPLAQIPAARRAPLEARVAAARLRLGEVQQTAGSSCRRAKARPAPRASSRSPGSNRNGMRARSSCSALRKPCSPRVPCGAQRSRGPGRTCQRPTSRAGYRRMAGCFSINWGRRRAM